MVWFRIFFLFSLCGAFGAQRVVLFNDTSAWYHWGCTGTSLALKEAIEQLGYELESIPIQMTYALKQVPIFEDFDNKDLFTIFCRENEGVASSLQNADAVVITGEGTIHDLRVGPRNLLYLAYASKKFLGKHVEIINHSAYPKDDATLSAVPIDFEPEAKRVTEELSFAQNVYHTVYSTLDFVAIREPMSQKEMERIGIFSTLSFDCLPLYIRDHFPRVKVSGAKTLVLAGSVAHTKEGVKAIAKYTERMIHSGYKIQVLVGAAVNPAKDDEDFVQLLEEEGIHFELIRARSLAEWLETIQDANLLVSGRFHHSIAAFCLHTPLIALNSNTHKVHAICTLMGHFEPLMYSDPLLFEHLLERSKEIESSIEPNNFQIIEQLCQLAEKNFEGLKRFYEKISSSQKSI